VQESEVISRPPVLRGNITYPPGPKSRFPGAAYLTLHRDPLGFFEKLARDYGDICHMQIASRHDYLISSPDYIERILLAPQEMARSTQFSIKCLLRNGVLTSKGETHRRERKLMQPFFVSQRNKHYAGAIARSIVHLSDSWTLGETRDVALDMRRLALAIVAEVLFGRDIETELEQVREHLDVVLRMTDSSRSALLDMLKNAWLAAKLPHPSASRLNASIRELDFIVYRIIDRQRSADGEPVNLLSALWAAHGSDPAAREQVRDEVMTMLLAGHETTASALTWTWYLLSEHPEVEAKMHAEVDSVLGGRHPSFDDLPHLSYTRNILAESMRLYPPVWLMGRRPVHDFPLGGYVIPVGAHVHVCQYVVHRDPRFFPDPHRFDPDRWNSDASQQRPRFSYFPFGAGPRMCIGEDLAWTEGILVLATMGQRWKLRLAPGHPVEPLPRITLHPKHGMLMRLEGRSPARN
jgi:cytochrome P450